MPGHNRRKKNDYTQKVQQPTTEEEAPAAGPIDTMSNQSSDLPNAASDRPAPAFGSGSIASSSFNFEAPSNGEDTNALARLKRKEEELDKTKEEYHDILVERDEQITSLQKQIDDIRNAQTKARKDREDDAHELRDFKRSYEDLVKALKKAEEDLKFQKGVADIDRKDAENLRKDVAEKDKRLQTQYDVNYKFKKRVAEQAASIQELHKKLDAAEAEKEALRQANADLALQQESTANDITKATQDFEQMFKDVGHDMDLNGYVGHVRDLVNNGQLKRQDSSLSLQRQLSPQKSSNSLPSINGDTLGDQLDAAEDNDDTLHATGLPGALSAPPADQQLGFSSIESQETAPVAGEPPKVPSTTASTTAQAAGPPGPISVDATTQTAEHSTTKVLEVLVPAGEAPSRPSKLVMLLLLVIYLFMMLSNITERWVWLSANDMTREAVVRAGEGGVVGWIAPVMTAVDRFVGVENAMLG